MEIFLTIILAIFLLGYLFRLLTPWLLKRAIRRMQKRYSYNAQPWQKEGEVTVEEAPIAKKPKKKIAKDTGDYVDFEEVK